MKNASRPRAKIKTGNRKRKNKYRQKPLSLQAPQMPRPETASAITPSVKQSPRNYD